ncbi:MULTISPECIES: PTS sugar transporter subunit IIA [unclassified Lysinibacillus]|uniref:PTS sugar transporter subunit IIA n=1 Tax=unclassified Lysinibacillus TaxID=2636778 RepID=UPI002552B2CF|nr:MULTISPECIES: PTS sugar transporter subunit IIA [unclassified Lysinibacillus]MDM5247664.1 PTS sugar transporter subunit IIA [Lysinibacillus sp. G4S2]
MLPIKFEQIALDVELTSPEEAIQFAGNLLLQSNSVEQSYVEEMINGYKKLGSYIVLAPNIAIPHARPEFGVNEQCIAFVRVKTPLSFGHPQNDDVKLIIPIGGVDKQFHLDMLRDLSAVLMNEDKVTRLKESTDTMEIYNILKGVS